MKHPIILFDADDTLFDFAKSEKEAFKEALTKHSLTPTEELYQSYKQISFGLWQKFEKREVTLLQLRVERYTQLFDKHGLSGDITRVSEDYLDCLKECVFLLDGAVELCETLAPHVKIGIVTNGIEKVQRRRLSKSPLKDFIQFMVVSEECGFAKPHRGIFEYAIQKTNHQEPSKFLMVGDRLETDILGAREVGMATCWYNPAQVKNETAIKPDYEVTTLKDILPLVGIPNFRSGSRT